MLIGLIAYKILHGAHLAFSAFGLSVKGSTWDANHKLFGRWGIYGTAVTSVIALVIATPLALAITPSSSRRPGPASSSARCGDAGGDP